MVHHYGRPDLFKANCRKYKNDELVKIVKDDNRPIFVAEDDGVVIGYAFCVITDRKDDNVLTDIKNLYIDDLCVDENMRDKHVGTVIYDYVKKYANQMKLKANIGFKADKKLRSSVSVVKVERSKLKLHSVPRSNEEIDRLLTAYFSNNQILTRSDFQGLCKLTLTTAARHIKRLKEEKKLQNINTRQSPVYVPMPGYYGKPEVEDTVK